MLEPARTPTDIRERLVTGFLAIDLDGLVGQYDEDAVRMPGPGETQIRGFPAIRAAFASCLERNDLAMMRYTLGMLVITTFFLLSASAHSDQESPFIESVVIFNTICAKCHEAQCSGRMSFDGALESSKNHILRYYAEASDKQWLQKELFDILNYMKEKCAFYPMESMLPPKRVWSGDVLDKMATLLKRNYFIPLGPFSHGKYRIEVELEKDTKITVHLVSEEFDMVVEDCFSSSNSKLEIPFSISDPGDYYFRMYPQEPVRIQRLSVKQ